MGDDTTAHDGAVRFYLAARFSRVYEVQRYRADLRQLGHAVISRWLDLPKVEPGERAALAAACLEDVRRADALIAFTESNGGGNGGRHAEFGAAFALGKRLVVVGPRENSFHFAADVQWFVSWDEFVSAARNRAC